MATWLIKESFKIGLSQTISAYGHDFWFVIMGALIFVVFAVLLIIAIAYLTFWERRLLAMAHYRYGPNRAGWNGLLQPLLDAVKLLIKEDIVPARVDWFVWFLAPIVAFTPMVASFLAIPMSNSLIVTKLAMLGEKEPALHVFQIPMIASNLNIGLLYIIALSSLVVVGIFMAGWGSNNKYSLFGGMRSAGQIISYEIPVIISLLTVALLAGSLSTVDIVKSQRYITPGDMKILYEIDYETATNPDFKYSSLKDFEKLKYFDGLEGEAKTIAAGKLYYKYNDYASTQGSPRLPFIIPLLLAFFIYFIAGVAETNRSPFDLPEGESEIVAGFHTEYTGIKFGLFFLGEYGNMILISAIATTCFLGGYLGPAIPYLDRVTALIGEFPYYFFWFILKVFLCVSVMVWFRATFPRLRVDQLTDFAWKVLLPISFLNLIVVAYFHFANWDLLTLGETNFVLWFDNLSRPFHYPAIRFLMALTFLALLSDFLYRYRKVIMPRFIFAEISFFLGFAGFEVYTMLFGSQALEIVLRIIFYLVTLFLTVWMIKDVLKAKREGVEFLSLEEEEKLKLTGNGGDSIFGHQSTLDMP